MEKLKIYIKSILIPIIIGIIIGIITSSSVDYNSLKKPSFFPPSILFPIVWTILYTLMGISYGILKVNNKDDYKIKSIYYLQLLVNALWPILFFSLKLRFFSFLWIILLDGLVFIMIDRFYNRNKIAGLLQIPYLIWILFASYLNLTIYLLNN